MSLLQLDGAFHEVDEGHLFLDSVDEGESFLRSTEEEDIRMEEGSAVTAEDEVSSRLLCLHENNFIRTALSF